MEKCVEALRNRPVQAQITLAILDQLPVGSLHDISAFRQNRDANLNDVRGIELLAVRQVNNDGVVGVVGVVVLFGVSCVKRSLSKFRHLDATVKGQNTIVFIKINNQFSAKKIEYSIFFSIFS